MPKAERKDAPDHDVTHDEQMSLVVKEDWMHFTRNGPQWIPDLERFLTKRYESAFDGSESRAFYEKSGEDPSVHHLGFIGKDKKCQDVTNYEIWPILFHYRPTHPKVGRFASAQWTLLQAGVTLRGRPCAILRRDGSLNEETCWVDVDRQSSIVRYVVKSPGYAIQTDVDYRDDPSNGWVPTTWKLQNLSGDMQNIQFSSDATVTGFALNGAVRDEEFRLVFPVGTDVSDAPRNQRYLVKPDGGQRLITRDEELRGAKYEDYVGTESGMAGLARPSAWKAWLVRLTVIVVALAGSVALWRRLRRSRKASRIAGQD
jgi:hypothetical protein